MARKHLIIMQQQHRAGDTQQQSEHPRGRQKHSLANDRGSRGGRTSSSAAAASVNPFHSLAILIATSAFLKVSWYDRLDSEPPEPPSDDPEPEPQS